MANLSDYIEEYLKVLFEKLGRTEIEIQRNELAEKFSCVPSQINYVLSTRFSQQRGYIVESRRGGGGYIRIVRLELQPDIQELIRHSIGDRISYNEAYALIRRLWEREFLTNREAAILFACIEKGVVDKHTECPEGLRARLISNALLALQREADTRQPKFD